MMKKTVTVIGGGTGTFIVLSDLKKYPLDLGVIVNMMDSGGSTGRLRDQLGVLPPGDLRQCLVALSEVSDFWRKLFLYRFETGDLKGHNFGNIFLSALEKVSGSYDEVLGAAEHILNLKGEVIPVTYEKTHVCAEYENGTQINGEDSIDENRQEKSRIKSIFLLPPVCANQKALSRIAKSDYLIAGPGDLYTSIIPIFLVDGVKKAVQESSAKIIYVMNLMTKSGQTTCYTAMDHVNDFSRYAGRLPDVIVMNTTEIPQNILEWYKSHDETPIVNDLDEERLSGTRIVVGDLINEIPFSQHAADEKNRAVLRHDGKKLAEILHSIIA